MAAAEFGRGDIIQILIENGADIEARTKQG